QKQKQPIALVSPPLTPNSISWQQWGGDPAQLYTINASHTADALWACEKMLKQGCFGAVLLWQNHIPANALRRLHVAAQHHDALFVVMRSLDSLQQHSPAPPTFATETPNKGLKFTHYQTSGANAGNAYFHPPLPHQSLSSCFA